MEIPEKCVRIVLGFVFVCVNANANEQAFTVGDTLNDRVCALNDRITEKVLSNLQCAAVCSESTECTSYFYAKSSSKCVACSGDVSLSNTLSAPGMIYYEGRKTDSSCLAVLMRGATESGVYELHTPVTNTPVQVYCDMTTEGGGWIVWQRRFNGTLGFQKSFAEYEAGFGDPHGEYWLGLQHLHEFLHNQSNEVYLEFGDWDGNVAYERYGIMGLSSGPDYTVNVTAFVSANYSLTGSGFQGIDGKAFSTSDHNYKDCVRSRGGAGFWFVSCCVINPNGLYGSIGDEGRSYIYNKSWKRYLALKETKLMIRGDM